MPEIELKLLGKTIAKIVYLQKNPEPTRPMSQASYLL